MKPKKTDLSQIKDSGRACVGCGRTSDIVPLRKLRTYARSLACFDCMKKYRNCSNENFRGEPCSHEPHIGRICQHCGCGEYRHGLESELDRQLADGVGKSPRYRECRSYGQNLGKCGRPIFAKPDGSLSRLCDDCEGRWVREVRQGAKEAALLLKVDETKVLPN